MRSHSLFGHRARVIRLPLKKSSRAALPRCSIVPKSEVPCSFRLTRRTFPLALRSSRLRIDSLLTTVNPDIAFPPERTTRSPGAERQTRGSFGVPESSGLNASVLVRSYTPSCTRTVISPSSVFPLAVSTAFCARSNEANGPSVRDGFGEAIVPLQSSFPAGEMWKTV